MMAKPAQKATDAPPPPALIQATVTRRVLHDGTSYEIGDQIALPPEVFAALHRVAVVQAATGGEPQG